jgi:hypothetical protein
MHPTFSVVLLIVAGSVCPAEHARNDGWVSISVSQKTLVRAQSGSADDQFLLGEAYLKGHGVSQDASQAFTWFHKAADHGHVGAMTEP